MQAEVSTAVAVPETRIHLRVALLCGAVLFLEGYDIAAVGYAAPSLVDTWKIHPSELTQVLTAGNVGLMIGSICAGLLGDRLGRKPVLIVCVTTFSAFSFLSAFATSPWQLGALRFLTGLGLGGGLPIIFALASNFTSQHGPARFLIQMCVSVPIGFAAGGILASRLVRFGGWPAIFMVGGILPLAVAPLLALYLPTPGQKHVGPPRLFVRPLFQNGLAPQTILLWSINTLNLLGIYFFLLWMPSILHGKGASPSVAILGTTAYGFGVIASPVLSARLLDRMVAESVLACGLGLGALCVLCMGVLDPPLWLLSILICGAGLGNGCQAGIISLSALAYPPAIRSTGTGWALGVGRIGTIAGPLAGGLLLSAGLPTKDLFMVLSIPAFVAALLMALLRRTQQSCKVTV